MESTLQGKEKKTYTCANENFKEEQRNDTEEEGKSQREKKKNRKKKEEMKRRKRTNREEKLQIGDEGEANWVKGERKYLLEATVMGLVSTQGRPSECAW